MGKFHPNKSSTPPISQFLSPNSDATGARRKSSNPSARRESSQPIAVGAVKSREASRNRSGTPSPRVPRPRSEEIPLEDFRRSQNASPSSRNSSNAPSRSHTPSRLSLEPTGGGSGTPGYSGTPIGGGGGMMTIVPVKESSVPTVVALGSSPATVTVPVELSPTNSEETSFIAGEERQKKRGAIETV